MITSVELRKIARARLKDAEVLYQNARFDGAVYLCGYAVEVALKARICRTLKWSTFPSTPGEFKSYQSFRTHDLDVLLSLSGRADRIKTKCFAEWSLVATWDPEVRYKSIGSAKPADAQSMIQYARTLLGAL